MNFSVRTSHKLLVRTSSKVLRVLEDEASNKFVSENNFQAGHNLPLDVLRSLRTRGSSIL